MTDQPPHTQRPFPWTGLIVSAVVVASVATAAMFLIVNRAGSPFPLDRAGAAENPLQPDPALSGYGIPEFALVDQTGAAVTADLFEGRISVVDFIFTNCPFVCPTLSAQMLRLQDMLRNDDVQLVSFSVDPVNDTPEVLREYAKKLGADTSRWRFLTGPDGAVQRVSEQGLGLGVAEDPANPITLGSGRTMNNIAHSSRMALIGPEGELIAVYSGIDPREVDALAAHASRAASALRRSAR